MEEVSGAGREPLHPDTSEVSGAGRESVQPDASGPPPPPRTGAKRALEDSHYLTHFPKDSRCETCSRCNMQRTPHRRKGKEDAVREEIDAKDFGDLVTADHIVLGSEAD